MAYKDRKKEIEYINRYQKEKYDRVTIMAEKGRKAAWQAEAEKRGMKLSAFVSACVENAINPGQE